MKAMMKYLGAVVLLLVFSPVVLGQDLGAAFEQEVSFRKTGMTVLGSWAVANIAGGLALRSNTTGSTRYFHEMNAMWNTVNLGIATLGYFSAMRLAMPADAFGLYEEQVSLDKVLLFNAGLDLGYIAAGLWMTERSRNTTGNADRWKGYGQSLMVQGAFLFVFDVTMVLLHQKIDVPRYLQLGFDPGAPDFLYLAWQF